MIFLQQEFMLQKIGMKHEMVSHNTHTPEFPFPPGNIFFQSLLDANLTGFSEPSGILFEAQPQYHMP